ncbi:NADH dehydrogenase [ubiquinone] iron-sulfur protein 6, mitochondrial-like [Dysidea avara]|uniref:NADH dehydrogenase [ubiquinone] iron-sulfur protein 6, mitochondrial-like n=1 Tax=Dysidea avara TaxID=196820 RepID=UPI0033234D57
MAARIVCGRIWRITTCTRPVLVRSLWSSHATCATDKVTHTGQYWEDEDARNTRFVNKSKQVNEQFAINLLNEEPISVVKGNHVWCDGGDEPLGHPKVYINLDKPGVHDCGYCGKKFVYESFADQVDGNKITYNVN